MMNPAAAREEGVGDVDQHAGLEKTRCFRRRLWRSVREPHRPRDFDKRDPARGHDWTARQIAVQGGAR